MPWVTVRLYQELNEFLTAERRGRPFTVVAPAASTTKALIENLGVPHTEIDLLLVNGASADFSRLLEDGDRVSVYPMFESWDISSVSLVRAAPLRQTRFIADVHLGKLARLLRMTGFDTTWANHLADETIVRAARAEKRIILSRDRGLLKRRIVTHGCLVRSLVPREQLVEVIRRFDLARQVRMFSRCMSCNGELAGVDRISVLDALPPAVAETCAEFSRCAGCGKVFWRGSHWEVMKKLAADVLGRQDGDVLSP